jgi:hypothetical protein
MEFPRLVYKSESNHAIADDEEEYEMLLEAGWFATVPEALNGAAKPAEKQAAPIAKAGAKAPAKGAQWGAKPAADIDKEI